MRAALGLAAFELRRFRGRVPRLALAFVIVVPTLYGAMYLWSNWDPYGRLDRVPVAVVNHDAPVTAQGKRAHAGAEFVEQLKANPRFDWRFTDAGDARAGLADGRYFFTIAVPRDFSRRLAGPATGSPRRARLLIRLDDANGFIVGIVAKTAQSEIQSQVNAAAYAAYAEATLGNLDRLRRGLKRAAAGAGDLADGASGMHSGVKRLDRGVRRLDGGATRLESGSAEVRDGTRQLKGAADAAAGAVTRALAGLDDVRTAIDAARQRVDALAQDESGLAGDPGVQALDDAVTNAEDAVSDVTGRGQDAARDVKDQVDRLADGAAQVADGAAMLRSGLDSAAAGGRRLTSGAGRLSRGAHTLARQLGHAESQIPATEPRERAREADIVANPVSIETSNAHPAGEYGRGLAPFFLSIALWVFGLVAYLMLRPVAGEALASRLPAWTVALGAWLPAAALGLAGALLLYAVVDLGLGLDPLSAWKTIGLAALAVATFTAIDHALRLTFGMVGDALSLVLLVLQLAAAGGVYPIETAPGVLRALNPVLPMTYLIDGFRVTISGGQADRLTRDVLVLAGFLLAALALTTWTVHRQRLWTIQRLKPEIQL